MGRITRDKQKTVKPFINIPAWMGLDFIKDSTRNIKNMLVSSFTPQKSEVVENFDQAITRQRLMEQDIERRKKEFRLLAWLMLITTVIAVCYLVYLIVGG